VTSFKPLPEVKPLPPQWFSQGMGIQPYVDMFFQLPFAMYTVSSLMVASVSTVLTVAHGSLAGYAFAAVAVPGKDGVPPVVSPLADVAGGVGDHPLFQLISTAGLYDTQLV